MSSPTSPSQEKILVVGDSYMSTAIFERALGAESTDGALRVDVDYRTMDQAGVATGAWSTADIHETEGTPEQLDDWIDGHTILAIHGAPVTRHLLEQNPSIRFIACARGGPVNIDLGAAKELGITVTTTPGKNAEAVADLTIGFLLSLWRNLGEARQHVTFAAANGLPLAESAFEGAAWFGRELPGMRLGLVGLGNVSRHLIARALPLGIVVAAYDPYVPSGAVPGIARVETLDELLIGSDAVSLHARGTADNRHMIGGRELALMPEGAVFINTARESLVDEGALLAALTSRHLGGAALDVCETEGPWRQFALNPRVILTPHIAGATIETLHRGAAMLRGEIDRHLSGEPLRWAIT